MASVLLTPAARGDFNALPRRVKARVLGIIERLTAWPAVSGAKPLRGDLHGQYRVRTGDYRVQFHAESGGVVVTKIGHRDGFYDE